MSYDKQNWAAGQAGGTPLSPVRLNHMEDGIEDADTRVAAVEAALPNKADLINGVIPDAQIPDGIARDSEVAAMVSALVNGAPSALDTLNELAAQLATDESAASALTTALANEVTNRTAGDSARVLKAGDSMAGDLAMTGHRVTGLADPAAAQDAATRAYVLAQITALVNGAPGILDTLGEIAAALQSDESAAAALSATVALKAPLASPAFTGTPTKGGSALLSQAESEAEFQLKTVGINAQGVPYYDASGAAPGEVASITTINGTPTVVSAAGATAPLLTQAGAAGAYVPFVGAASYTYNADGTVATATEGGIVTTYSYNADGTVHTAARSGVTFTYSYNADGTVAGVA